DLFWKASLSLCSQTIDPEFESIARCSEKPFPFFRLQLERQRDRRKPGCVQDLIRVGVADPADEARICQSAFQRTVFRREGRAESVHVCVKDLNAAGIHPIERLFAANGI